MIKLQRENVVKVVDSSLKRDKLFKQGFVLVQTPVDFVAEVAEKKEEFNEEILEAEPKLEDKKSKTLSKAKK